MSLKTRLVLLCCTAAFVSAPAQQPGNVDAVLHQLDAASATFKSAEADLRWDVYEKIVRDTTTECGAIYYQKSGSAIQMGARTTTAESNSCTGVNIAPANASRILEYKAGNLEMFEPKANHLDVIRSGPNQAQYESYLTLGFGGSGRELAKAWNITDQGTEVLKDGSQSVTTVKLDLVAKDPAILKNLAHITIWVDPARGISLKQQFFAPNGDSRTTWFTNIRYNQKIGDLSGFAIKTDKQTSIATH